MANVTLTETKPTWEWDDIFQGDIVILNGGRICIATTIPTNDELMLVELADGDPWERDQHATIIKIIPKDAVTITVKRG